MSTPASPPPPKRTHRFFKTENQIFRALATGILTLVTVTQLYLSIAVFWDRNIFVNWVFESLFPFGIGGSFAFFPRPTETTHYFLVATVDQYNAPITEFTLPRDLETTLQNFFSYSLPFDQIERDLELRTICDRWLSGVSMKSDVSFGIFRKTVVVYSFRNLDKIPLGEKTAPPEPRFFLLKRC